MALLIKRLVKGLLAAHPDSSAPLLNEEPQRIVLKVKPGITASRKSPVRIYLGTEDAQYRAERIFVWSIEQVRDPSRVYEIYLMKNLAGFRRRFWLTGFTNYRFAIPDFAGRKGRAIYNDVDQVYLADPAELFDMDMQSHGYLSITARDTSVMLLDCNRMASVWGLQAARSRRKNSLLDTAAGTHGLWGELAPVWNARNDEYQPGESKVLHYTILHTQPWRPFPEEFVYLHTPQASVWHELANSADLANYKNFTAERPSENYDRVLRDVRKYLYSSGPRFQLPDLDKGLRQTLARQKVKRLLVYVLLSIIDRTSAFGNDKHSSYRLSCKFVNPASLPRHEYYAQDHQAVVCIDFLEYLPDEDIPWLLDAIFSAAESVVYCHIKQITRSRQKNHSRFPPYRIRSSRWWHEHFKAAGLRYPHVHWKADIETGKRPGRVSHHAFEGGSFLTRHPVVWVLTHSKPGQNSQTLGLADSLEWPYQIKQVECSAAGFAGLRVLEALSLGRFQLNDGLKASNTGPAPDVIIAAGWLPTRVARLLQKRSDSHIRLVLEGRKAGAIQNFDDIVISSAHFNLPPHPRRIDALLPPHSLSPQRLKESCKKCCGEFSHLPRPHVALLVGGTSKQFRLDAEMAETMCERVQAVASAAGGCVLAITSRRSGEDVSRVIHETLSARGSVHLWSPHEARNPYHDYLADADAFVVTGESESMLAEAISTGKPVYIYPVAERPRNLWIRLTALVAVHANTQPLNNRGTVRPQQGLEYLCARMIERGIILPPRDLDGLHQRLVEAGLAHMFGEPLNLHSCPPENTTQSIALKVRQLLGVGEGKANSLPDSHSRRNYSGSSSNIKSFG